MLRAFTDFHTQIVSTDDYMPMPINNPDEYDKVINVSWYTPEKDREQQKYVCSFGASKITMLICLASPVFFLSHKCTRFVASTSGTF